MSQVVCSPDRSVFSLRTSLQSETAQLHQPYQILQPVRHLPRSHMKPPKDLDPPPEAVLQEDVVAPEEEEREVQNKEENWFSQNLYFRRELATRSKPNGVRQCSTKVVMEAVDTVPGRMEEHQEFLVWTGPPYIP